MATTHTFKGSKGSGRYGHYRYGYYAYIENGLLVIGEDWPHEGGEIYRGSFVNAFDALEVLRKNEPKLFNSITEYYKENPEKDIIDPVVWVENKLKASFQKLEVEHRYKADEAYVSAMRADNTTDCEAYQTEYELNRKLSEVYRMMSLRAHEYAKQFKGV